MPPKEKGAINRGPKDVKRVALTVDDFTGTVGIDYLEPLLKLKVPLFFPLEQLWMPFVRQIKASFGSKQSHQALW